MNDDAGIGMLVAKGVPCAFRHCEQWQTWMGASSPSTWNLIPPQRQLPICTEHSLKVVLIRSRDACHNGTLRSGKAFDQ